MLTVSYRNKDGVARKIGVPEIDGVEPAVMLAGVVKSAIADAGPIAYVRLVTDTEAGSEADNGGEADKPAGAAAGVAAADTTKPAGVDNAARK